ncbi:ATP-binding protein [Solirubrobacter soli]|uniref:ATP-binding protein n=1 Tax=Solirubrobacter soli TaxID=363832 RepID=UPI0003FF5354|nr:LuxR family transcriptional regulator [Solirubrobacter soli]
MPADTFRAQAPLIGRQQEQQLLVSLLDEVAIRGQALVLRGEPGIGKSALLAEATRAAHVRDISVLSTAGVQSEAHLPFAGLHQLLRPVRGRVVELPAVQRAALDAAFGLTDQEAPEHFRIAMAVLDLLSEVAPVLAVVDDAQWLDRPTLDVLAFVARRIEADPIVVVAATRDGYDAVLADVGLSEHRLAGLDEAAANALLDASAPGLSLVLRAQVLREAAGNPLALLELPATAHGNEDGGGTPLTKRLERAFAGRVADLPAPARRALLVAALNDGDGLDEILRAADVEVDALTPAVDADVVSVDLHALRFRHPLIRSAVAQSASLAERIAVHQALAVVLDEQPDRRAWHRAALLTGEHEDVALELEAAGDRARRRGALAVAVTAIGRAAQLGESAGRSRRLLTAAALAVELGRRDIVERLLGEVNQLALGELERARAVWVEETAFTRPLGDIERFTSLIAAAERAGEEGDHDLHVDLLWLVASRAWWADPGPEARRLLIAAARRLGDATAEDPRVFAVHAYADPTGHAAGVLARLRCAAGPDRLDADAARFYGPAALVAGAFDLGDDFLAAAVGESRTQGRLGHLPRLLVLHASMAARLGDWDVAITAGEEARRLAEEIGEPQWAAAADTALSMVAAMRGDQQKAQRLSVQAELVAEPVGANITVAFAQFGKVLAALADGRHADAYACAERLFAVGDSAYHPVISSWLIADLAEAALHIDRHDAARRRVAEVEARAGRKPGTWIALVLGHARALVAEPAEAGERFEAVLASDLSRWPYQRARIELAYGQWLRRRRRVGDSRAVLRSARDTFDALGCAPWSEQARQELRASGERSRRRVPEARDELTAQELQIAQLAAEGLSNREIGQRLYLSHRTVSTHLYRVFPKLGITSRAELGAALTPPRRT